MSDQWRTRAYSTEEACRASGFRRVKLDVWIHRECDALFCEKRRGHRWFSPKDIAVLRTARDLVDGGMVVLSALATAFEFLDTPPAEDAVLVMPNGAITPGQGRLISDRDVARLAVNRSIQLIPLGKIVAQTTAAIREVEDDA